MLRGAHQRDRDAQPLPGPAHAPLEHRGDAERVGDGARVELPSLEREGGRARGHLESSDLSERGDQLVGEAVREGLVGGVAAGVDERQDGDRRRRGHGPRDPRPSVGCRVATCERVAAQRQHGEQAGGRERHATRARAHGRHRRRSGERHDPRGPIGRARNVDRIDRRRRWLGGGGARTGEFDGQIGDHRIDGRRAELLLQQRLVHPRVAERARAVARGVERAHQPDGHPAAQGVGVLSAAPPDRRAPRVAAGRGALGEQLERLAVLRCQRGALGRRPALEGVGAAEQEAVEEGARVERHRRLGVTAPERAPEVRDVARDERGVQLQRGRPEQHVGRPELLAERVHELLERCGAADVVALRPQVGRRRVAADAGIARRGEQREQRESLPLPRQAVEPGAVTLQEAPTEGPEPKHAAPARGSSPESDRRLTGAA